MAVRVLIGPDGPEPDVTDDRLAALYAAPPRPWLRVNMVSTVDGAATGDDGRSGGINNVVDKRVFRLLRRQADAIVVGARTAEAEGYRPVDRPTVVVSGRGVVPPRLVGGPPGSVVLATRADADGLREARRQLGAEHVVTAGHGVLDLALVRDRLHDRGWRHLLSEGGPTLLRTMLAAGVVDELCATTVPRLLGGEHPRIVAGPPVDVPLSLALLLEEAGTTLARWTVPS